MKSSHIITVVLFFFAAPLAADLLPATITKSFSPSTIPIANTSLLTVTLTNPNPSTLLSPIFFDQYPAHVVNASPLNVSTTCGGTFKNTLAGFGQFVIENATIPASGSCTVTALVTADQAGTYVNTTGPFFVGLVFSEKATATLNVVTLPLSKAFTPNQIDAGGQSTLTITLGNMTGATIPSATFFDFYPGSLVNAATPNALTTCSGGTLTASSGGNSLSLIGTSVPPGGCTTSVQVTSAVPGTFTNSVLLGVPANFVRPSATANLQVNAVTPALSSWALLLLCLVIGAVGAWRIR